MKAPVHVICGHEAALGVGLAGVAPIEAASVGDAATALVELARAPGIALVEGPLYDALPAGLLRQIRKAGALLVMPFPGPAPLAPGSAPDEELLEVLRRAVGYRVRLR